MPGAPFRFRSTVGHRALNAAIVVRLHAAEPIIPASFNGRTQRFERCHLGSSPSAGTSSFTVVQSVERPAVNRKAAGSSPARGANGRLAQWIRAPSFYLGGCRFESYGDRQLLKSRGPTDKAPVYGTGDAGSIPAETAILPAYARGERPTLNIGASRFDSGSGHHKSGKCYGSTAVSKTASVGSTPTPGATYWPRSSVDRAPGSGPGGRRFDPCRGRHIKTGPPAVRHQRPQTSPFQPRNREAILYLSNKYNIANRDLVINLPVRPHRPCRLRT